MKEKGRREIFFRRKYAICDKKETEKDGNDHKSKDFFAFDCILMYFINLQNLKKISENANLFLKFNTLFFLFFLIKL